MGRLFENKILILSILIIVAIVFFVIYKNYVVKMLVKKQEGFGSRPQIETPASSAYGIDLSKVDDAYDNNAMTKFYKNMIKYSSQILRHQQKERIAWMKVLINNIKVCAINVIVATKDVAEAGIALAFASSSLISIDPIVVIKAIAFQIKAIIMLTLKTIALEKAKNKLDEAIKDFKEARKMYSVAAEHEYMEKELNLYQSSKSAKQACDEIAPTKSKSC